MVTKGWWWIEGMGEMWFKGTYLQLVGKLIPGVLIQSTGIINNDTALQTLNLPTD